MSCYQPPCPPSSTGPCPSYPNAKCVVYTGSNLLCSGIKTNDRLDTILEKIDELFCTGGGGGGGTVYIEAGEGVDIDGVGTLGNPYVVSSVVSANSGLTLFYSSQISPPVVKLGQQVGESGDPAKLLRDTEIPLGDFSITFNNNSGTGPNTSRMIMNVGNSSGISLSQWTIEAVDQAITRYNVNNTVGTLGAVFYGSGAVLQGSSGYSLAGAGGHFFLSNMIGGTTSTTVEIASVATQIWNVTGDTTIGLTGSKLTGFGGITAPTAYTDVAASTSTVGSERIRAGVTPSSGYLDGLKWYDGTHYYIRIGSVTKQLDNDANLNPGDFIQNQTLAAQTANYWISGTGRADTGFQVNDAAILVKNSLGDAQVSSISNTARGETLYVDKLKFADSATGNYANGYIGYATSGNNAIDVVTDSLVLYGSYIQFFPTSYSTDTPRIHVGGNYPLKISGSYGQGGMWNLLDLYNANEAGANADSKNVRLLFTANRNNGTVISPSNVGAKQSFGRVGIEVIDFSQTLYKGDLVFETVSASVNTGSPTEYMRLKYDGRLYVNSLDTDTTAPVTTGTTKTVVSDSTGLLSFVDTPVPGFPAVPISILQAATAGNNIDNGNFTQIWRWGALTSGRGLALSSAGTASQSGKILLQALVSGAHATSGVSTFAATITNAHTGVNSVNWGLSVLSGGATATTGASNIGVAATAQSDGVENRGGLFAGAGAGSTNYGIYTTASGAASTNYALYADARDGTTNYSGYFDLGDVLMNSLPNQAADRIVTQISGTKILGYVTLGTGLSVTAGVLNATIAGLQTFQSTLTTGSTLTGNNTVAGATFNFVWSNFTDYTIEATGNTFLKIAGYGSASNGDVLYLVDKTTGRVGWVAPGGAPGSVTSVSIGNLSPIFTAAVATATSTPAITFALTNAAAHTYFGNNTAGAAAPAYTSNAAFVRVNDTNVTLTLTGAPTTALLETMTATLGWTGTLSVARGGTALSALGGALQVLRVNSGATALEYATPPWLTTAVTTLNTLTAATQTFAVGLAGNDFSISSSGTIHTFDLPDAAAASRGVVSTDAQTFAGVKTFNVGVVVNETGVNTAGGGDFRVESDTNTNALLVDATNNRVGIFTASPSYPLHVTGNSGLIGNVGIGTAPSAAASLVVAGSGFTTAGILAACSVSASVGSYPSIITVSGTIIEAGSGTHPVVSSLQVGPTIITAGLASVTDAASLYISGPTVAVGANSWSILVTSGNCSYAGAIYQSTANTYATGGYDLYVRNQTSGRMEITDPSVLALNSQSGLTYTLVLTDKGSMVQRTNAAAQSVTIPLNASVAFPVGTQLLIEQTGTGQITFIPTGGVTMNSAGAATKTRVQWVVVSLIKTATNTWTLSGDITT